MLTQSELNNVIASCDSAKIAWNSEYFEAFAYTQPERNYIFRAKGGMPGNNKQVKLFTQAGKVGTDIFVARVQNKLSPIGKPYYNFSPKHSLESDYIEQLRDFAESMSEKVNERKNELRIDNELHDAYYDLAAGTAMIMREDSLFGMRFRKIPFTDYKLGTERVQTVARDFELPAYQIPITFPELQGRTEIGGITLNGANQYQSIKLNDCLYFNESTQTYEYYLRYGSEILMTRKYKRSPYYIFHWSRACDMPYGTGVALKAKPALKRLNKYVKAKLELLPFNFPMFITQEGNIFDKNIQYKPGGFLRVKNIANTQPISMAGIPQQFMLEIQNEEIEIKETFLSTTLPTMPTDMTAAEINARTLPYDEAVHVNISLLTDTIKDIGWALFDEVFNRELAGTVNFTLEDMHELLECNVNNDASIDNNLIQKISGYINNIMIDPSAVWQTLNRSKTLERLGRAWNVPMDITRTAEEIDEAQEAAANAQAAAMQQQVSAQMAVDTNKADANAAAKAMAEKAKEVSL